MCNASPVKHKYLVRDSAACFLIDYNEAADNWQMGDRFLTEYLEKNPEVSSTLLNTLAGALECSGSTGAGIAPLYGAEAASVSQSVFEKAYTAEYRQSMLEPLLAITKQFERKKMDSFWTL